MEELEAAKHGRKTMADFGSLATWHVSQCRIIHTGFGASKLVILFK